MDQKQNAREKSKNFREKNPNYAKEWARKNSDRRKDYMLKYKFGITLEDYNNMLKAQDNTCAICLQPSKFRKLAVDHCHTTNRVRGLLCSDCNRGIGLLKDNIKNLERAINYLERTE